MKTYQVEQLTERGDWKVTDRGVTREYANKTAAWVKSHGGTARVMPENPVSVRHHATKKSPAQLQREIDEVLASKDDPIASAKKAIAPSRGSRGSRGAHATSRQARSTQYRVTSIEGENLYGVKLPSGAGVWFLGTVDDMPMVKVDDVIRLFNDPEFYDDDDETYASRSHATKKGAEAKLPVKAGLSTLDKPMTREQAKRWGDRNMPADLKRAGFETFVGKSDPEMHGGVWYRVSYSKR